MPDYTPPTAYVGMPVQWMAHARDNDQPQAGQVIAMNHAGTVKIAVIPPSGSARSVQSVPHIDDPRLVTCPEEMRIARGAWRYVPGLEPKQPEPSEQAITSLADAGASLAEIAKVAQTSKPKVESVLKKHGRSVPA